MHIHLVSLFPEIFESFLATSLIQKAQTKGILKFSLHNPREYCQDKHQQIDDQIYGGGEGMLIKAQPIIDCVEAIIQQFKIKNLIFQFFSQLLPRKFLIRRLLMVSAKKIILFWFVGGMRE